MLGFLSHRLRLSPLPLQLQLNGQPCVPRGRGPWAESAAELGVFFWKCNMYAERIAVAENPSMQVCRKCGVEKQICFRIYACLACGHATFANRRQADVGSI